jgi:hypothetical protein
MEWVKAISQLFGSVAWPASLVILCFMFRREIRQRLTAVTEVKYPGGSITMKDVEKLEASVQSKSEIMTREQPTIHSQDITKFTQTDAHLSIAQMRLEAEREIFRLSQVALGKSDITSWHIGRHIDELEKAKVINNAFANNLRSFIDVANRSIHEPNVAEDLLFRSAAIGGSLISSLHHIRLVHEAERDFDGHGLWHMHRHIDEQHRKYYFWSAVASMLPDLDYNYDIYREAIEKHNNKAVQKGYAHDALYVLTLDEFLSVLEFRETELQRLIRSWHSGGGWQEFEKANEWHWPTEWGHLGWNCPILRQRVSLNDAEQDIMRTRAALDRHRAMLLSKHN